MPQQHLNTENLPTQAMAMKVEELLSHFSKERQQFERKWYDNNFFDDGYHFRYLSRTTGKILDTQSLNTSSMPSRAIPKASRQIRGVANLLLLPNYTPVIYPEKVASYQYPPIDQNGQQVENPEYQKAIKTAQDQAKKIGHWVQKEWINLELEEQLTLMVLLAAKHGVSYMQLWPDGIEEKINAKVYDAFDIYVKGSLTSIYDSPAIIKTAPMLISEIMADETLGFEGKTIAVDNKYAYSKVKEAYSKTRYGSGSASDTAATAILSEAYIKEYLSDANRVQVEESLKDKISKYKDGDMVMRHVFTAGGVTGKDEYLDLPEYPFIDFRMEPGPIYQVPLIERFIPANKTLDVIMSRLERYFNTMVTGTWLTRKGENVMITNIPGGQKLEYTGSPPVQAAMQNPQTAAFPFIQLIEKFIEEQGASTSALGQLPQGVRSGVAIESVKQTEFSNLRISSQQLKRTIRLITIRLLDYAADWIEPKDVYMKESSDPTFYSVIGENGANTYKSLGVNIPQDTVVIRKDHHVDIEVEQGMGMTVEGQKETLQKIIAFFVPLASQGLIAPDAVKQITLKLLELYGYGSTQELVDSMDQGTVQMNENQIMQMKVAVGEVLKDAQIGGAAADNKAVMASKVGTLEALKESGMAEKIMGKNGNANKISESMSYKDAPPSIKRQMESAAGFEPATQQEHTIQQAQNVNKLITNKGGQ